MKRALATSRRKSRFADRLIDRDRRVESKGTERIGEWTTDSGESALATAFAGRDVVIYAFPTPFMELVL
jgi:hypothetical protein